MNDISSIEETEASIEKANVWKLYQAKAADFARERQRFGGESKYFAEIAARIPAGAAVLDLGCGSGVPIARFFIDYGFALTGVDAAPAMIDICRERFPDASWFVSDMRRLALRRRFHAILAWDSFFHLPPDDQRAMFEVFRAHAAPGALLLFTSGPAVASRSATSTASRSITRASTRRSIGSFSGTAVFRSSATRPRTRRPAGAPSGSPSEATATRRHDERCLVGCSATLRSSPRQAGIQGNRVVGRLRRDFFAGFPVTPNSGAPEFGNDDAQIGSIRFEWRCAPRGRE